MTEIPDAERKSKDGGGSETVARTVLSGEQVSRLLNTNPAEAEVRAREAIAQQPENPGARWLLGAARRRQGDAAGAKEIFQSLVESHPQMVAARFELGLSLRDSGAREAATAVLLETVDLAPNYAAAWYALGDQLDLNDKIPSNIKLRADTAFHAGRYAEAEANLTRCFESAPDSKTARFQYAVLLLVQRRGREALQQIEHLLKEDSSNFICLQLKVTALSEIEEFEHAIPDYENILKDADRLPGTWLAYGRALRALGRYEQAIAAWRRAIEIFPGFVDAYWSLATIKTFRFDAALTDLLRGLLLRSDLPSKDRAQLHFALGKVLEDEKKYAESFDNYQKSHALQQSGSRRTNEMDASFVRRAKAVFSKEFFRERADAGCPARAPIFIVGLPRSGSTLIRQILAAHSQVDATLEFADIPRLARELQSSEPAPRLGYPGLLGPLSAAMCKGFGEKYLLDTAPFRT
ncbi:MAG TPA: tetratricopeptide repeat protein, partial [Rhizomicrobium sp.]